MGLAVTLAAISGYVGGFLTGAVILLAVAWRAGRKTTHVSTPDQLAAALEVPANMCDCRGASRLHPAHAAPAATAGNCTCDIDPDTCQSRGIIRHG